MLAASWAQATHTHTTGRDTHSTLHTHTHIHSTHTHSLTLTHVRQYIRTVCFIIYHFPHKTMTSKNELSEMGIIEEIWSGVSSNAAAVAGVHIDVDKYGRVPPQCCFRVVEASTAAIACSALAAAEIDSLRRQNTSTDAENDDYKVHINPWHAYAEFKSETLLNLKTSR